jgi:hypothetical protein
VLQLLVGALAVAGASCAGDAPEGSAEVTRADFGTEWPLTVEQGELRCDRGVVTFTADEVTYAVNAAALEATDHPQIDPIWADDPNDDNGLHMSLSPLLVPGQRPLLPSLIGGGLWPEASCFCGRALHLEAHGKVGRGSSANCRLWR